MRNMVKYLGIVVFAAAVLFSACKFELSTRPEVVPDEFIPVEDITGIPTGSLPGLEITLSGTVMPANATNKRIEWSIAADGGTRAALERNKLAAADFGTVTVTARIKNGLGGNVDYTQNFDILISTAATAIAVTSVTGIPATVAVGDYTLNGWVKPANALNKTITWSVKDAGATGAEIYGNTLTTTAAGTAVITATVANGKLDSDYTQDFTITVYIPFVAVSGITGIPSTVLIGDYKLNGVVTPANATNQTITWSLTDAGETGAVLDGNTLTTTAEGVAVITATVAGGTSDTEDYTQDFWINIVETYIEVTGITGILSTVLVGDYELEGVVEPFDAANQDIVWSVKDAGGTGAAISGNTLTTTAGGTVTVTATIAGGLLTGNYTQDFEIIIYIIPVTGITGIQTTIEIGDYELDGVVAPPDATNQTITWSVKDAGATGAEIDGNTLTTTAAGTAVITATVAGGLSDGDYTQDFSITVNIIPVTAITGIPSTVLMGGHALTGIVHPPNATNQTITWAVKDPGATGATMSGNTLTTTAGGTLTVTATIAGGLLTGNYTQDFEINITESFVPVTGISGVPQKIAVGNYTLTGAVAPANASNKNIEWSIKDEGETGATINVNTLTTTAVGTVTITATIVGGVSDSEDYAQDFDIETIIPVTEITGIPAVVRAGEYYLYSSVEPYNATNQDIVWGVKNAGTTGAAISYDEYDNLLLTTTAAGTAVITATVAGGLPDGDYTQDFTITVRSVYAIGSYVSGNQTKACYWIDGECFVLDGMDGTDGNNYPNAPVGIVLAGGHFYIAGTYRDSENGNRNRACYWVDGGNLIALPDAGAGSGVTSIAAEGSTVYIVGTDGAYPDTRLCYWKIENGAAVQTVLNTDALKDELGATTEFIESLGTGFAVDSGNVYIPVHYNYSTDGINTVYNYYMYVNGDFTEIACMPTRNNDPYSGYIINAITVLNGTVYIAGRSGDYPFYGDTENSSYTQLSTTERGRVNSIIVLDDGSLRFYGRESSNYARAWDAEGNNIQLYGGEDTIAVTYSDSIVYIAFRYTNSGSGGYRAGAEQVYLNGPDNESNVTVTGLAVK